MDEVTLAALIKRINGMGGASQLSTALAVINRRLCDLEAKESKNNQLIIEAASLVHEAMTELRRYSKKSFMERLCARVRLRNFPRLWE